MRKGVLELCVLSVISDQEVYTSDILSALKEAQLIVVEGTVYPLLTRLKNDGISEIQVGRVQLRDLPENITVLPSKV